MQYVAPSPLTRAAFICRRLRFNPALYALAAIVISGILAPHAGFAQSATVNGFVTDQSNGQPLELVNVALRSEAGVTKGAATNQDGLYLISGLEAGTYVLNASFIGYRTYVDTLDLTRDEVRTVNMALVPDEAALGEVVVQTERTTGAARVTAGQQTVRPADIELVPTPDLSGDLVTYLTTLPGVVATGDRGGQLFIRGGEPSQNLVQLDGILLYQPFHLLGFYSAFPSDILNRVDIYAGGFGSKFGERISSVIDIASRNGNNRRFAGAVSVSPFVSAVRLEGPLLRNRISLMTSIRQSTIEQGAQNWVDQRLPFTFGDAFAKIYAEVTPNSRLSATALRTYDRGTLAEDTGGAPPEEVRWQNEGLAVRYLLLPRVLPVATDLQVTHARLKSEMGAEADPSRVSEINNTHVTFDASFLGERLDVNAGLAVRLISVNSNLGGLYQNVESSNASLTHIAQYLEMDFDLGGGLSLRPGLRLQFYQIQIDPFLEPRLRVVWQRGIHQISGAAGVYRQEILGMSDRRDAASVFTAWSFVPKSSPRAPDVRTGRIPRAMHGILGYRATPSPRLELSIEGFYKDLSNLFISEWTSYPRFTTRLQPATGKSLGFDARVEMRLPSVYGYVNYGLSSTRYEAEQAAIELWYGTETLRFRPPHDRRHQLNALLSATVRGFEVSARWEFGSGFPFSRALGFDGFALIDDIKDVSRVPGFRRVIYERPYNGVLPTYHRLDLSIERTFTLGRTDLTLQGSLINVYDRRNLFYLDVFTLRRVDQLPIVPSAGIKVEFR